MIKLYHLFQNIKMLIEHKCSIVGWLQQNVNGNKNKYKMRRCAEIYQKYWKKKRQIAAVAAMISYLKKKLL